MLYNASAREDWSYISPPRSDIDLVRLIIGDTNRDAPKLRNGEIQAFLLMEGDMAPTRLTASRSMLYKAASRCARAIGNWFADHFDRSTQEQHEAWSKVMDRYYAMADLLIKDVSAIAVPPRVGGQSRQQKIDQWRTLDLPQPRFKRDSGFTEPGTGGSGDYEGSDVREVPW